MVWSPTFKVTMGSRGPDISEPQQPYLISKSASPTTVGASSSFLALGHSFFQGPKAWHQPHWFGCNGAQRLRRDRLKDSPVPGAEEVFPRWTFPKQQLALQISCLFSFVPSGSLAERSVCLIPTSPSPSRQYSPGRDGCSLGGSAGAGSWKCWPEASVTGMGACRGGGSMTLGRAGRGAAAAAGPGSGIEAASNPGGAVRLQIL